MTIKYTTLEDLDFLPEWASPPGSTISDMLEERGWSISDLAKKLDRTVEQTKNLINGQLKISEELANRLTSVFGVSVGFWLSRESQYREALDRLVEDEC